MSFRLSSLLAGAAGLCFAATLSAADSGGLMHCFAFTAQDNVSDADLQAFYQATDALPEKMSGVVTRVWHGKLMRPLAQFLPDGATYKQLQSAGGTNKAKGEITRVDRQYGVCMEMADQSSYDKYAKDPAHDAWNQAYKKVMKPGTTTFDIVSAAK